MSKFHGNTPLTPVEIPTEMLDRTETLFTELVKVLAGRTGTLFLA